MRRWNEWGHLWWSIGVAALLGVLSLVLPRAHGPTSVAKAAEARHTGHVDEITRGMLDEIADYQSWGRFTGSVERAGGESTGHGSEWTVRYFNGAAGAALRSGAWRFPVGSAFVSEDKATPDGPPSELTAMIKQPDGEWYWIAYTPYGRLLKEKGRPAAGHVGSCIVCHSQSTRDMVLNPVVRDLAAGKSNG